MYTPRPQRRRATADGDSPTAAQLERRRQSDLAFISWVRRASIVALRAAQKRELVNWRRVAIERALRRSAPPVHQVAFFPDEGFPLSIGYVVGADDGVSTLYPTPAAAIEAWVRLRS